MLLNEAAETAYGFCGLGIIWIRCQPLDMCFELIFLLLKFPNIREVCGSCFLQLNIFRSSGRGCRKL